MRILIAVAALICLGTASAQSDQEIFEELAVTCVSSLGLATMLTDQNLSKMVFERDAKWWRAALESFVDPKEAESRIMTEMRSLNDKWNEETLSWDELLDASQSCSEMKLMLESAGE